MPDPIDGIAAVLNRPGLAWMVAWVAVSAFLVSVAYVSWRCSGWVSDRIWAWRHPPIDSLRRPYRDRVWRRYF